MQDSDLSVREASSSLAVLPVHLSPRGDAAALPALSTPSGQPFRACPPDHTAPLTGGSSAFVTPKPGAAPGLASCVVSLMHGRTGGAHPTASLTASAAWFAEARAGAAAAAEELVAALPHFPVVWLEELAAALVAEDRQPRCGPLPPSTLLRLLLEWGRSMTRMHGVHACVAQLCCATKLRPSVATTDCVLNGSVWIRLHTAACTGNLHASGIWRTQHDRVLLPHACRGLRFVTCSKLASGRALLIGDAAHAMSPNLGMGCNLALQDTLVLSDAIDAHPGNPEGIAAAYDSARRRNAHAATRLSELLDATVTYKYHRCVLRAVAGWPVTLTAGVNYVPASVPLPGAAAYAPVRLRVHASWLQGPPGDAACVDARPVEFDCMAAQGFLVLVTMHRYR